MSRRAWAIGLVLLTPACAIFAGKSDYADYRQIRLARDDEARAVAMQSYVERHPTGAWHDEIQATRKSQDLAAFEAGKDTRAGLEHYLRAYPDGAFVVQARGRLSAVALIEQRKAEADREAEALVQTRKARTDELRRTWVGRFIGYWAQTLIGLHGWGEPIAEVAGQNPTFSRAFAAQPRPRCTQDECLKYYTSQFAVPVRGGNRVERTLSLVLRLRMKGGKLERAELLLPEHGFSRWYELENRQTVADGDAEGRAAAVAWAIERSQPLLSGLGELVATREKAAPTIDRPAIGPSGESVDTSIEAPSDPQNRVSGPDENAGIGADVKTKPAPSVNDLIKPQHEASPDMVFAPVGVNKQGQKIEVAPAAAAPAADGGVTPTQAPGEVMSFAPVAVPKSEGSATPATTTGANAIEPPPSAAQTAPPPSAAGPVVRGFLLNGFHVVMFAAGAEGPGYDGLLFERATPVTTPASRPKAIAKPATPPPAH